MAVMDVCSAGRVRQYVVTVTNSSSRDRQMAVGVCSAGRLCQYVVTVTNSSSPDRQMAVDISSAGRLRQYVHQRNNTVNHLLTVLLVLCVTSVLGLGVGHFLGESPESSGWD